MIEMIVLIRCDECMETVSGRSVAEARRNARREGWVLGWRHGHRCADCLDEAAVGWAS